MKTFLAPLIAVALAAAPCAQGTETQKVTRPAKGSAKSAPKTLKLGVAVPASLAITDLDGKSHKFGDFRGKVVFIHFWSVKCPWERYAEPKIMSIADDYGDKDLVVLAINSNQNEIGSQPDAEAFTAKNKPYATIRKHVGAKKFNHNVLFDHGNKISSLFQARTTPHCYVIDKKGVIRYAGGLDDDKGNKDPQKATRYVRDAIDAILANKEIEVQSSRPYG